MIDTDKYEGHDNWEGTKVNMANEANKLLIADAPLLLEAYKRLREQQQKILRIAETNMALEWGDTNHSFEWGYIIDMIKGWTE